MYCLGIYKEMFYLSDFKTSQRYSMSSDLEFLRRCITFAIFASFVFLFCVSVVRAETPTDAPVLISQTNSTKALVEISAKRNLDSAVKIFPAGAATRVTLFVTNLDLMAREGANAFRADAETAAHQNYPLEIESLGQTRERSWVYALTIRLNPAAGDAGDVLVRVTWRGVSSNRVRLSIGHSGGKIRDDEGAAPTPLPEKPFLKNRIEENAVGLQFSGDRIRFLQQATFGATPEQDARLRRIGIRTWLSEQLEQKYDDSGAERFSTLAYPNLPQMTTDPANGCPPGANNAVCVRDNYTLYQLQNWFFRETLYGEDQQLRRRVAWALSQILVVSGRETVQPSRMIPYLKILDKNAFGNYRNLLYEMTLNPAMGNYLDLARSTAQDPNENYAREILQLFSVGLDKLNVDGTPVLDQNGSRIPTYDQNTVNGFAKVFTGWTFCNSGCQNSRVGGIVNYVDPLVLFPNNHDSSQKMLLNYSGAVPIIPAGQSAEQDLNQALDNIFNHPNVAPFISKILIRQLVTSNPTPAYVARISAVFNNNGNGIRGDLKAVVKAILLDPEARGNLKTDPLYGHLKEPNLFVANFLRALHAEANTGAAVNCNNQSDGVLNSFTSSLDQDTFNPPSVFNYYQLNYQVPSINLAGPEFAILTTSTTLKRSNFTNQMTFGLSDGQITTMGIPADSTGSGCGTAINPANLQTLAEADATGGQLVDALDKLLLNGSISAPMRDDILTAIQAVSPADSIKRARTAIYLVTTSSQYQVQR